MGKKNPAGLVRPAPKVSAIGVRPNMIVPRPPHPGPKLWAPAWLYSALNWLGKTFFDANHVEQRFHIYVAGSDVDPYAQIGATRLFLIVGNSDGFELTIAEDADADARISGGTRFANTDEGIRELYLALVASPVFARVKYCYVPTRIGPDLDPERGFGLDYGYDPATGLRGVLLGSAVSQVVPLDDFLRSHNEQIYDAAPTIVPLVTALVYDVTQHNQLGATTFALPAIYTRDRVAGGTDYVNHLGQTVAFPGGPGYDDALATALTVVSTATVTIEDHVFTTYTFDHATVVTTSTLSPKVETGIATLTYASESPASVFANQQIIGFYRDSAWTHCNGLPIWDYGTANAQLTATTATPATPTVVYDPTHGTLNGGTLKNVVQKLRQATDLYSWDVLAQSLETATSRSTDGRAGLGVAAAALDFAPSPRNAGGSIVDQLDIPIVATVTTTPLVAKPLVPRRALEVAAERARISLGTVPIGAGGNTPSTTMPAPVTVQVGLDAWIPREALDGTGIDHVESGTAFFEQALGSGAAFKALAAGTVVNLMARAGDPPVAPLDLALADLGLKLVAGVRYVLSVAGKTLTVRGSDGSTTSVAPPQLPEATHRYVGAMAFTASTTSARLYPLVSLAFPAPAVGTHGIQQGESYSLRFSFGKKTSAYDVFDSSQAVVASQISITSPKPGDGSAPRAGDLYFGSFVGGASTVTVWSTPVFVALSAADLAGASFDGTMTLDAQVSGVPEYKLKVTDSSAFVFWNIDIPSGTLGGTTTSNVFLAAIAINSSPDDRSAAAFAPCNVLLGVVRRVQMGSAQKWVFVPAQDSIIIGGTRYMVGVIELTDLGFDPNDRPYPPLAWPHSQYWQFANKHIPYRDVRYTGATQADRVAQALQDSTRIGEQTAESREPIHLYLDVDRELSRVWPIFGFPFDRATQTVDGNRIKGLADTIAEILATKETVAPPAASNAALAGEKIAIPDFLSQSNPYLAGTTLSAIAKAPVHDAIVAVAPEPKLAGVAVTNLAPGLVTPAPLESVDALRSRQMHMSERASASIAADKAITPAIAVIKEQVINAIVESRQQAPAREIPALFGFSIHDPRSGEAYLVEVVGADQDVPDRLPNPTEHVTYDPYYVRVVFLNRLICYQMSIIVPAIVHDQYGHFAYQGTTYDNLLAKTEELELGYIYEDADSAGTIDQLTFTRNLYAEMAVAYRQVVFTNAPYAIGPSKEHIPPIYFACRRKNWISECHLMRATHETGSIAYLAFGAGDIAPMRLDADFEVDKRLPAHLYKLTYTFSDREYDSAKIISFANKPYVVAVTGVAAGAPVYMNFSIDGTSGTAEPQMTPTAPLAFPTEIYVAGQASTTLTTTTLTDTGQIFTLDDDGNPIGQEFQLVPYNNLVYLVRAISNNPALAAIGGLGAKSGLLIDTYVPAVTGNLALAQGARHKRSGLSFFGASYTPTTMVDTTDNLDFTRITGEKFLAPTIFIPIPELDATKGFIANLSNFLGQQFWTFVYPEISAHAGQVINGVDWLDDVNIDADGKPVLSLQKLHFVYDPLVVLFTPNDLTHKYPLQPKQQVLALTNGQIQEGICWRSANVQDQRQPPSNICAQQLLPAGPGMDRPNIIYSAHNRPVATSVSSSYLGMSVNSFRSVSGVVYNIEESALANDQTATSFISQVSSTSNLVIGVLFDYDNNDLGDLQPYNPSGSTKGMVFLNGYLSASGYSFSSPDHFDVNDVLESQTPLLEHIAATLGFDVAFFNTDVSLPRQFWSMAYDAITAPTLPNFIPNVPPSTVDPQFTNRTRSLVLNLQNPVHPDQLGMMDTFASVVSANVHLENGVTGSVFLSKKADRDVASIGTNPTVNSYPLYGLPTKYDFFIFSRDHYWTLKGATFELIDHGYAMCLVDDGSGTGTKVAKYFIDTDGNYYELMSYALYSPNGGILEMSTFPVRVTLGSPGNVAAVPIIPETPNNVNPQDIAAQINKVSNLIYAAFGPSTPGQPPAFLPIQAVAGSVQAAPITGAPGFSGYQLNVVGANLQPVQISQIYSGSVAYAIAGSTTSVPFDTKKKKPIAFFGSIAHGLDRMVSVAQLQSADLTSFIPRTTVPPGPSAGLFGGNGLGALIGTPFCGAFQGSKGDDAVFYTFNAITLAVMDSTGKSTTVTGGQYFVDPTDAANPVYVVATQPFFLQNGITYYINLATTLPDGVTSRYSLVFGGKSFLFDAGNRSVTVDDTRYTFHPLQGGVYTVTYSSISDPAGDDSPSPIQITPFSLTAGGVTTPVDVFNDPGALANIVVGVVGRQYTVDPIHGQVTVTAAGSTTAVVPLQTAITYASTSGYGYAIGFSNGSYTINGAPIFPYAASTTGTPATLPLMTSPQMFTLGGNFYTFDRDASGNYVSVTGGHNVSPINPYQFSINGAVYIINTNVQPNTVIGGGNSYPMRASNTQFEIDGVQYTITLKQGSLNGATVSGQFNVVQGNVVVIENYVYEIDTPNSRIVGNGTDYPLTTSGVTYTISAADRSFTVTTEPNATTVTIGNIVYQINNTTVVGDAATYPILGYRSFTDGTATFTIGNDGVVSSPATLALAGGTFTDPDTSTTYAVTDVAAFDGTSYFVMSGTPAHFSAGPRTYTLRTDGASLAAGPAKTYFVNTGALNANQFPFGTQTVFFKRAQDLAAFDGHNYFAITNGQFTDTVRGATYTLSGNTAVHAGNSYEVFSNLGQGAYFQVPSGPLYFVNVQVADLGSANGDIFSVFPISSGVFTMPIAYTVTVAGASASVSSTTFGGATAVPTLTAAAGSLTGGFFTDPVTKITYTCVVDAGAVKFIDSNNASYPLASGAFVASVVFTTAVNLVVDDQATPVIYPVTNNQFSTGAATYTLGVPVAHAVPAGALLPMVNGRFIVAQAAPRSSIAYTIRGSSVVKGYVVSTDDQFSVDGNVVYAVDAVNVVKASNLATLSGASPNQTLTAGALTYSLNDTTQLASVQPTGLTYDSVADRFTVAYAGTSVTYTVGATNATDDRQPQNAFPVTTAGANVTFTDTHSGVTFTFDGSGNNPITARFAYVNQFFIDPIAGVTYYVDEADTRVEAISYLPELTQYAFTPADGKTYLIHYNEVDVTFPVISGANVNAGIAAIGANTFVVDIDNVQPLLGGSPIATNPCSFEINGNLYTITGTPNGSNYQNCSVVGNATAPLPFITPNQFKLTDPSITYTLHLDAQNLPHAITASFPIQPSRDLLSINDDVYLITYNTVTTGSLLGQGQSSIPITGSGFTLTNRFDSTKPTFTFADLDIFDASSVVGQFAINAIPTFFLAGSTYTLDTTHLVVTDDNKRPFPLLPNPLMFSINGFNYVIDTNQIPHAIVGNNNVSPLATDITVQSGTPIASSTFTLNGQVYELVEDAAQHVLAITGTKLFPIAQPALTFKLDSSLVFTLSTTPPAAGNYPGTTVPIGTITAGSTTLNVYAGRPESGSADFFLFKNVMYTLLKSGTTYVAVQKSYTVYAAQPATGQQQLAVFDLAGTTYLVTDGTTTGVGGAAGINPGTMWAATAISNVETQFGLVYGFGATPTNVTQSGTGVFQFQAVDVNGTNTLYDILYTAGGAANVVKVDVPALLPTFTQAAPFSFTPSYPLTFETGGYNAFTTFVEETSTPNESFAAAYKTPVTSTDHQIDQLLTDQGDFSVEFWHSIPSFTPEAYHPFTYAASSLSPLVNYIDLDFEDDTNIFVAVNNTVMQAVATPPMFSSGWRHVALSYRQPYTMVCRGAGFEVKQGSQYNFNRDFSIAMTFSASDVSSVQGLLYKGTGSDITPPQLNMSYRVGIANGAVTLQFTDGNGALSPVFTGTPTVQENQFYQLIIVKSTTTPAGRAGNPDPYAAPFDTSDLGPLMSGGMSADTTGFPSGGGSVTISNMAPAGAGAGTPAAAFLHNIASPPGQAYSVSISIRTVNDDGSFGGWDTNTTQHALTSDQGDPGLVVLGTGGAHLLIGAAFDDQGHAQPLGDPFTSVGNIRQVYLFNSAIDITGIHVNAGTVNIADATADDLRKAGLVGFWSAAYDPDGVVVSPLDPNAIAISTNQATASLLPLSGHEREGITLYVNGFAMTLSLVTGSAIPPSLQGGWPGGPQLDFQAGDAYRLCEISMWRMARQSYQVVDDMFGRLIPSNEPSLIVYLSGSFQVQAIGAPILPMAKYIDNIEVKNAVTSMNLAFSSASLDLAGCPAVGRCGPLITPNLYTPPGVALTVCDTPPDLATYSVTLNSVTGTLAGELNEAYVYVRNNVLTLYAGKKIGDLVLSWVSQEQGDVQLIGYVEGAPPAPMANLTNKASYAGATSLTLNVPTSVTLKLQKQHDSSDEMKLEYSDAFGARWGLDTTIAPFGAGFHTSNQDVVGLYLNAGLGGSYSWIADSNGTQQTASNKLDEVNKYTIKLQGAPAPLTLDPFMANLNSVTTPSTTVGTAASKSAILPNPNLGGFTTSNPASALPSKAPPDEKFGARMFVPSPYGQAFVASSTLDVYQQTLLQTNTVFGFVRIPNTQIPRDLNIVSFRMNSQYLRPGVLDGVINYAYKPATLPTGAQTFTTSTGEMQVVYDKNFSPGTIGHDAGYMRVVEAYKVKRQIDQQAFNAIALYHAQFDNNAWPTDSRLTPSLDFYNEYIWTSRGGTQEVKHTWTTTFDEVVNTTDGNTATGNVNFNLKLSAVTVTILDLKFAFTYTTKWATKTSFNTTGTASFDISAAFDGLETDTQMRYASNNDAHFVMKLNSMFNQNNQSGLNLVIGSDGLVYNIAPNVSSGAGLPTSNNLDDNLTYSQPQPAYTTGSANGLTGALEPYDRPGKVKQFRTYAFFLQPAQDNADNFWNQVVDPLWLANSDEADARAMRSAQQHTSLPWRVMYRVTYCERFLPPVSTDPIVVPQITPVIAIPVLDQASDFIFQPIISIGPRPANNPANDIEANIVLVTPTASGAGVGTLASGGPGTGSPVLANNVIPFDFATTAASIVNWGDTPNTKLLTQLTTSVLGLNTVTMSPRILPGSTKQFDVVDPITTAVIYSVYIDPNGATVNVLLKAGITVYQDVNGNPIQYYDGKSYHSLQADYVASPDGTVMYYIQPPAQYDQSTFDLAGDYDLFGRPGDQWRYFLVSGMSANMTAEPTVTGYGPFLSSDSEHGFKGFTIAPSMHDKFGNKQVQGYVLAQGVLQWPHLNSNAETFADVLVYKAMSLLDTFPIGDPEVLVAFLKMQYSNAPFIANDDICLVFARNIISYFNALQQNLIPQ